MQRLWTYLDDDGAETMGLTYAEVDAASADLAAALLGEYKLQVGDRALLVYPPSLHFVVAFMACLRAGVIAVPVYPPDPRKLQKDISAFARAADDSGACLALTSSLYDHAKKAADLKAKLAREGVKWPALQWVVTTAGPYYGRMGGDAVRRDERYSGRTGGGAMPYQPHKCAA
ncbi:hypothetical protein JKP88DRAFT_347141 [Tribonema minus]|uniref:AMP-dependent synthetase/ligase domain-containing protein n=1 Tax=Tribonema minus TaxID=303371 RepID=A0A836C8Y2_9STRA|nr:hypothetical protein JKP88DRAFT_347141 [Tribonema minus]